MLPLWTLRSHLAFFHNEGSHSPGLWSRRLQSWGSQMDLSAGLERAQPYLCLHLTGQVPLLKVGKHALRFLIPRSRQLQLSASEELDVVSVDA